MLSRPRPSETDFTTSAVDLHLGPSLFELRSPVDLQSEQPGGIEVSSVIDARRISIPELVRRYAREVEQEPDGSFEELVDRPPQHTSIREMRADSCPLMSQALSLARLGGRRERLPAPARRAASG